MNQAAHLIRTVADSRSRVLQLVHGLSERQAAFKPTPDCWSINEILEHLVLAELVGVSKAWAAAEGVKSTHPVWSGEHNNAGLSIEEVVARTWKDKEVAPPVATPHIGGPLSYWLETLGLGQSLLEALERFLQGMDLRTIVCPHVICGPLDAAPRIQFLRFHLERHGGQIERLMNGPDFPARSRILRRCQ